MQKELYTITNTLLLLSGSWLPTTAQGSYPQLFFVPEPSAPFCIPITEVRLWPCKFTKIIYIRTLIKTVRFKYLHKGLFVNGYCC
jgi:hypothetical protein